MKVMHIRSKQADAGFTLIELIFTTVMMGLLIGVVAAAVTVVFRTDDGVVAVIGESHDRRQTVNYLTLDVESGGYLVREYRASIGTGLQTPQYSGCDAGSPATNLLEITLPQRGRSTMITYRAEVSSNSGSIDRYVCTKDSLGTWVAESVTSIVDELDPTAAITAEAEVVSANPAAVFVQRRVAEVEIRYTQSRQVISLSASPRTEPPLGAYGDCGGDPLAATQQIDSFIEGDVHLNGTNVKSALAVGGKLSWSGSNPRVASAAVGQIPSVPSHSDTYLYAQEIDWSASTNTLSLASGNAAIGVDNFDSTPAGSNWNSHPTGDPGQRLATNAEPTIASPIDFGVAFVELKACSDLLASLPDACVGCATFVGLESTSGGTYMGTNADNTPTVRITDGLVNVLNITETNLAQLSGGQIKIEDANDLTTTVPLVINVASDAAVNFVPPQVQAGGTAPIHIIWNFPNAREVSFATRTLYGTLFAPYADVYGTSSVEGGVVARKFVMSGSSLNDQRAFDGEFNF